jgi:Fe2+ transport system protein B
LSFFLLLEALAKANKRVDDLALKLEQSKKAREKAELDAASVESLCKRLHEAETALSDNTTQQIAREEDIIARLESQNRRFVSKFADHFDRVAPNTIFFVFLLAIRNFVSAG